MSKVLRFIIISFLILPLGSCILSKIPNLNSIDGFSTRKIEAAEEALLFEHNAQTLIDTILIKRSRLKELTLSKFIEESNTNAFLIVQDGKLIYEWYNTGYSQESKQTSFSIAKSVLSALVGVAIHDGKIQSENDSISSYLPSLKVTALNSLTIKHLLQMTSGIRHSEIDVFYSNNAPEIFSSKKLSFEPGKKHEYWSTNSQLLGLVLQKAIAPQSISSYLTEKIWQPMGAEYDAEWSLDNENGIEKTFCCIQATARDYARFGQIYLNNGYYNQQQIISEEWVNKSIRISTEEGSVEKYNYGWWFPLKNNREYTARGFKGQYIFINKDKKTVIVRLGKNRDGLNGFRWSKIFSQIIQQL